jgi:sulfur-oxidizing protein SoxB
VAGWAPVAEGAAGEPVWEVVARYLRSQRIVAPRRVNQPKVLGVKDNPGISPP